MNKIIELENKYIAQHYKPFPVVLTKGAGVYLWDDQGNRYLDFMSAYSAVSHGHCNPRLVKALTEQANTLAITSRAYYTDKLAPFLQKLCTMTGQDKALPMNTGAEAVETAIKAARRWAYNVKGVPQNKAEIITCEGNFHGRTTTIVSFTSEPAYQKGFGPFTPGFKNIPYNDTKALKAAITPNTAAFLVEPIQGEAGIVIPDPGYLKMAQEICQKHNVLLICDEIQTGLGRTGKLLACQHDDVKPDGLILGKALGGGLLPVSMFLAKKEVMDVFTPGSHGSTFGGSHLASAVGLEALKIIEDDRLAERSHQLGQYLLQQLRAIKSPLVKSIRGKGLFVALEIDPEKASARDICLKLMPHGLLSKETHATVVRLAPPLVIKKEQIDDALSIIKKVL